MKGHDERLVELEMRLTEQEELIDQLNQVVVEQQAQIDRMTASVTALVGRVQDLSSKAAGVGPADERPPHY